MVKHGGGAIKPLAPAARQVLRELDPAIPGRRRWSGSTTVVTESVAPRRFSMLLLSAFAVVALFLAAVGPAASSRTR